MTKEKSHYRLCFVLGFCLILFLILPDIISNHGIYYTVGDIKQQGIPFIYHLNENIKSGNFLWDWHTGLGINQIGAYSYYNLFSPFSLITLPLPSKWLAYIFPLLMALKFGTGAVTAYAYLRQYLKTDLLAVSGALLYIYSTFTAYNLVFHFLDIFALFPLLLLSMDQLTDKNRRGFFALCVALMAMLNYYFFLGQVIFCILYFVIRSICKKQFSLKIFISVAIEAVIGVLIAGIALLPTAEILVGSSRISADLSLSSLFLYETGLHRYGKIIQSMFTVPDYFPYSNFFFDYSATYPNGGSGSSIALYLPLFSMVGVISFIKARKKDFGSILLFSCLIIAFVPVLNNLFSALSPNYYARWYYMPMLIMSLVTMRALDENIPLKIGVIVQTIAIVLLSAWLVFYNLFEIHRWDNANFKTDRFYAWAAIIISVLSLCLVIFIIKSKKDKEYPAKVLATCCLGIFISSGFMVYYGLTAYSAPVKEEYIAHTMFRTDKPFELDTSEFFRIQTYSYDRNYMAMHDVYSMDSFHSIYEQSMNEFYDFTNVMENNIVALESTPDMAEVVLPYTALFSAAYYIQYPESKIVWDDKHYKELFPYSHVIDKQNGYYIYRNENYIPMGFTYDYYATREQIEKAEPKKRAYLMLRAIILEENELLPQIPDSMLLDTSFEALAKDCEDRRKITSKCTLIKNGLESTITLPKENYVFYSIPYDKGFKAFDENGEELEIIRANIGLSAVRLTEGTHTVTFKYRPITLTPALICSASGVVLLAAYWIFTRKKKI